MRAALLFLAVMVASAQTGGDARSLLKSISNVMRSADSLRVEGMSVRETTGDLGTGHQEVSFELFTQGPLVMRYQSTGPGPELQICDGTSLWTYAENPQHLLKEHGKRGRLQPTFCALE